VALEFNPTAAAAPPSRSAPFTQRADLVVPAVERYVNAIATERFDLGRFTARA
jgi:hypothetical protein